MSIKKINESGGMPFGHEFVNTANSAEIELAAIKRDQDEKKADDESKSDRKESKEHHAKSFDEFIKQSQALQEMEAVAATTTNTPGMGNVSPGEIGSYEDDDDDDDEVKDKKKLSNAQYKKWKHRKSKAQKIDKEKKKTKTQRPAWELGGPFLVPVANTGQ